MSLAGHQRQIGDVRDESGIPPIASELARRSNDEVGQLPPSRPLLEARQLG
jgi:hypothetical protein